jgi:hypothetical protein
MALAGAGRAEEPDELEPLEAPVELVPEAVIAATYYEGPLAFPQGVACDRWRDEVLVADGQTGIVSIFSSTGSPLFAFEDDRLEAPAKIATDRHGNIYVLDRDRSRILVYSYRGEFLRTVAPTDGEPPRQLTTITVDDDDTLWVADGGVGEILALMPDGRVKLRFGRKGSEKGEFQSVSGIWLTPDRIVVSDAQALGIQVFERNGRFLAGWGRHAMGRENVSLPSGVAVDARGRIALLDGLRQEIKYFDFTGRLLDRLSGLGSEPGEMYFPRGLTMDRQGRLCVADTMNHRVQLLRPVDVAPKPKPPSPPDVASPPAPIAKDGEPPAR